MSFLLTLPGMIAAAFVVALLLGLLLPNRWKTVGLALAVLAAAFAAVRLAFSGDPSAKTLDIGFAALWAALGAFPGAALGCWIRTRFSRSQ